VTGREIVRSAQLTVEVAEPAAAARGVRNAVTAAGGFVAEEQVEKDAAWLVVRVPVTRLDGVVDDLAATGTVTARSARAEDATDQVVDLDSRVATQQASLTRVRALLEKATSIGDVVALESELAAREADLDSLQRRLAAVRDQVALSTVTVELRRPAAPPAPAGPPAGFGSGLGAGWDGLKAVGTAVAVVAGFLLPFLPLLALAAAAVVAVRRRARRARVTPGAVAPVDRTPAAAGPAAPEQVAVGTRGGPGPEGV
jgi:polyhydroxyalkanoate synthesis regulator phasin